MKIQPYSNAQSYAANKTKNNTSFGTTPNISTARKVFEGLGNACNIEANGSLTRLMFFLVATLFMLGGRFVKSRDNDEKREVITRDVPAVALSAAGAPLINKAVAFAVSKKSGIPIVTLGDADAPLFQIGKDKATGEYEKKYGGRLEHSVVLSAESFRFERIYGNKSNHRGMGNSETQTFVCNALQGGRSLRECRMERSADPEQ